MIALILGAIVAIAAVVLVSLPFFSESDVIDQPDDAAEARLELIDARDRALAALKELEFDHRTGKIDDVDYRRLVGPFRRAAADALKAIDEEAKE